VYRPPIGLVGAIIRIHGEGSSKGDTFDMLTYSLTGRTPGFGPGSPRSNRGR
jgi:hypothetical protein